MKKLPDKIALTEFVETWPRDTSGMKAHRLMLDLLGTTLIDSAGAPAKRNTAQAQLGAHRALVAMIHNLRLITAEKKEPKKITPMKSLARFTGQQPENPTSQKQ